MHRRIVSFAVIAVFAAVAAFHASAYMWRWMVFFDSGSAAITDHTARQIADFHARKKGNCPVKVFLTAHMDAAEALDASSRIDGQRAEAVADRFKRLGTPAWTFDINARRDTWPLVHTKPGEVEPQNRRVELSFVDLADGELECEPEFYPSIAGAGRRCTVILSDGNRCPPWP